MTFKPRVWAPIAIVLAGVNLVAVGLAAGAGESWHAAIHAALALGFGLWAQILLRRRGAEPAPVTGQFDDVRAMLDAQSAQIAELQERVDFTERLLAQIRERPGLAGRD